MAIERFPCSKCNESGTRVDSEGFKSLCERCKGEGFTSIDMGRRAPRKTSIDAYYAALESGLLSRRRQEAYDVTFRRGPLTAMEAARLIPGALDHSISPRFAELRDMKVMEEIQVRPCMITGENVIEWDTTDNLPIKLEKDSSVMTRNQLMWQNRELKELLEDVIGFAEKKGMKRLASRIVERLAWALNLRNVKNESTPKEEKKDTVRRPNEQTNGAGNASKTGGNPQHQQ